MTSALDEGLALAGFELLTKLSSGGMGDVLLARRHGAHGFEKLLAIKTIRGELAKRPDIRAMFLDEARLCARLDHPAIAQVYDFGEQNETLFLAMEYVPGIALNKLLAKRGGPLPAPVAMRIVAEVLRGLHAAHELTDIDGSSLGVVHRDVSPGNLILTFEGRMKILDFGIAIMNGRESPDTVVGELKGKPSYMAPEHLRAERVDRRADVYSASVVLHELLTGRKLFTRDTVVATVHAVANTQVQPPSAVAGALPAGLDELVLRGLEKGPDDRFPDARAMAAALDKLIAASAGETLEHFVERELAAERDQHKVWLTAVLHAAASGADDPARTPLVVRNRAVAVLDQLPPGHRGSSGRYAPPPGTGAATGAVPRPRGASGAGRVSPLADPGTTVTDEDHATPTGPRVPTAQAAPRKRRRAALILAALALVGVYVGFRLANQRPVETVASGPGEPTREASPPPREPALAATTATRTAGGAGTAVDPGRLDGARPERETTAPRPRPKEPRRPEGQGPTASAHATLDPNAVGFVTIGAQPYALVRIDGQEVGVTPIMRRRLPAGPHEIQLVSPDSGEVRLKKTVTLAEGEHQRITYP